MSEQLVAQTPGPESPTQSTVAQEGLSTLPAMYAEIEARSSTPAELRDGVYGGMYNEVQAWAASDPTPTQAEIDAGVPEVGLEPQLRGAVFSMRAKGHNTLSSGFDTPPDRQRIDFADTLPAETIDTLLAEGFELGESPYINTDIPFGEPGHLLHIKDGKSIVFTPENPTDLQAMEARWNRLASLLPDLGRPASPTTFENAARFRQAVTSNTLAEYAQTWYYSPEQEAVRSSRLAAFLADTEHEEAARSAAAQDAMVADARLRVDQLALPATEIQNRID